MEIARTIGSWGKRGAFAEACKIEYLSEEQLDITRQLVL